MDHVVRRGWCCYYLILVVLQNANTLPPCKESLAVKTSEGYVIGCRNVALDMTIFYGIPYASTPKGRDKFKAPLPPAVRLNPLFATDDAVFCPQQMSELPATYQEECLVLNVFVPDEGGDPEGAWPVVVYVHGGHLFESGYSTQRTPVNIVQGGVVAVTFNHRVGAHGFLCLGTPAAPGNAALKDAIAALKWVRKNIANFKGDPNRVTLAGFGAGADIALLLLLSPSSYAVDRHNESSKLFQNVILESPFGLDGFALNENPVQVAKDWASRAGADDRDLTDEHTLGDFFLSLSFDKMFTHVWNEEFRAGFGPCVELAAADGAVVTKHPADALQGDAHYFNNVPVLTGYSDGEGQLFYSSKDSWLYKMCIDFPRFLPPNFRAADDKQTLKIADWLRGEYLERDLTDEYTARRFVEYFTDSVFAYETVWMARALSQYSQVYLYEFTYVGSLDLKKYAFLGAGHLAATRYVLRDKNESQILINNDRLVRDRVVAMWTNFIKHGKPIISRDLRLNVYWEPINGQQINYMQIDTDLLPRKQPREKAMKLWESVWAKKVQSQLSYRARHAMSRSHIPYLSIQIWKYIFCMAVYLFVN